jgi:hypothetical protein
MVDVKDKLHTADYYDSRQYQNQQYHGQSSEEVARWLSPFAPRHQHPDLHPRLHPHIRARQTSWRVVSHPRCALDFVRSPRSGVRRWQQREAHAMVDGIRRSVHSHVARRRFDPNVRLLLAL